MLLNLEYSLKCDAYIGTLASNTCRLMDELRSTIGTYTCVCMCTYILFVYASRDVELLDSMG